ncbi:unnamed protein product [Closterium sp. Naga37s-1]|nr:unnamed protein product [Closterium sp. Naga37s-1]
MSQRVSCACGGAASSILPSPPPVSASPAAPELSGSSAAPTSSIAPCLSPSSSTSALLAMYALLAIPSRALPPTTLPPLPLGLDNGPGSPYDHSAFLLAAIAALPFSSSPMPHSPDVRAGSPPPLP